MNFRVGVNHLSVGQCGVRNAVTVDDRPDDVVDDEVVDGSSVQLLSHIAIILQAVLIKRPRSMVDDERFMGYRVGDNGGVRVQDVVDKQAFSQTMNKHWRATTTKARPPTTGRLMLLVFGSSFTDSDTQSSG